MKAVVVGCAVVLGAVAAPCALPAGAPGFAGCRAFVTAKPSLLVRPRSIVLACADANFYATGIRWSSWTARGAAGAGTAHVNDCVPYCAAGRFRTYRLALRLAAPKHCRGRVELTRVSWRYPGRKPAGPRTGSETFRCR